MKGEHEMEVKLAGGIEIKAHGKWDSGLEGHLSKTEKVRKKRT